MNRYFFEVNQFLDEDPAEAVRRLVSPRAARSGRRRRAQLPAQPEIPGHPGQRSVPGRMEPRRHHRRRASSSTRPSASAASSTSPSMMDMNYHEEDFGQTLAVYGAGEGPYLHLPIIGSGNPRDYSGRVVDYALDPLTWVGYAYNVSEINTARAGLEAHRHPRPQSRSDRRAEEGLGRLLRDRAQPLSPASQRSDPQRRERAAGVAADHYRRDDSGRRRCAGRFQAPAQSEDQVTVAE